MTEETVFLKKEVKRLKERLKELDDELLEAESCCPQCGSRRWGRPNDIIDGKWTRDFDHRECSNCDTVYNNPIEGRHT